ncbi:MAG: DsbA family protein [Chloroflexi bacterium]|nr:DsbA family protein [Chloroflexota bacterium]
MEKNGHHVRFLLDPSCPWAYRASLWIREVARNRPLTIEWRLFSLEYVNRHSADLDPVRLRKPRHAIRLLARALETAGNGGIDALYLAIGEARHVEKEAIDDQAMLAESLARAGLSAELLSETREDNALDAALEADYQRATKSGAFGVPTLFIDGNPAPIYGPLIDVVPHGEEAIELWDHVAGLTRLPYFLELKRNRT